MYHLTKIYLYKQRKETLWDFLIYLTQLYCRLARLSALVCGFVFTAHIVERLSSIVLNKSIHCVH